MTETVRQAPSAAVVPKIVWGQWVDPAGLPELFKGELAPAKHERYTVPEPGIDNMHLRSTDTFFVPSLGKSFTVDFAGYFQVTRGVPSTYEWNDVAMAVNYTDIKMFGTDPELGPITVALNQDIVSGGEIYQIREPNIVASVKCQIGVGALFTLHSLGITAFNKRPVLLRNPDMKGIPTVGEGGEAAVNDLPLYNVDDPNGTPVAYLTGLHYTVLNYMTREEALRYRAASSEAEFAALAGAAS